MGKNTTKIYCFVDETGQDTGGKMFLVVVVQKYKNDLQMLREKLIQLEISSRKNALKWKKTSLKVKQKYLLKLINFPDLKNSVYFSKYFDSKEYIRFVALTIAKTVNNTMLDDYSAYIVVDALNVQEAARAKRELKRLGIKYKTVRGMKDEQESLLRLADAIAGFVRDYEEGEEYAKHYFDLFKKSRIIREI